jgi:hypothetical protein
MFRHTLAFACVGLLLYGSSADGQTPAPTVPASAKQPSKSRAEDGWFDISAFLDSRYGFLPLGTIITEPAVGLGAGGGLAFMDAPLGGSNRPNIFMVGGFGTENGTKGAVAGDMRYWADGRVQTLVGAVYASVNLDFYGLGDDSILAQHPLRYNLEPAGGVAQAKFRLGSARSPAWAGISYAYFSTAVAFDAPPETPGLPDFDHTSKVGGITPSFTFDSRDTIFTASRGCYVEGTVGIFDDSLGSDEDFQRASVVAMQYAPLPGKVYLGFREQVAASSKDTPFYLRPFVLQRGVPAMRYLGEEMAQLEVEVRWQFWKRFSLVGFGGGGVVWTDFERLESPRSVAAGGVGFRYELARKYGLHVGLDVAYGPDGTAVYFQWGSAWIRP